MSLRELIFAHAPATIFALAAFVTALINRRTANRNSNQIQELHITVNSRLDQLIAAEKNASFMQGVKHEQDAPEVK